MSTLPHIHNVAGQWLMTKRLLKEADDVVVRAQLQSEIHRVRLRELADQLTTRCVGGRKVFLVEDDIVVMVEGGVVTFSKIEPKD